MPTKLKVTQINPTPASELYVNTGLGDKLDSNSANYVKSLSISGKTITVTKGNNTTSTLTTQDTTYTHPTTSGNKHIPSGGSSGQVLVWASDGTAAWSAASDSALPAQTGNSGKFLTTNGTSASWSNIPVTGVTTTGTGNVITSITDNGSGQLSATKGITVASLESPAFTGTPTAPTATAGDNSTQIATTAFVKAQGYITSSGSITGNAATATKLGTSDKGSSTQPIYLDAGVPTACTYTLAKSVPSDAKFTDTVYTHPTTSGNKHIPSGGSSGQFLKWSADGTAVWAADNNTVTTATTTGSGNAVTAITASNGALTVTKGTTFLTEHQSLAYLTKTTNVSEMGRYIDMHYDNATAAYDYDVRLQASSQGTAAGKGNFSVTAASMSTNCALTVGGNCIATNYHHAKNGTLVKGTKPSSSLYSGMYMCDKNGTAYAANALGLVENCVDKNNLVSTYIRAIKNEASSSTACTISCNVDASGNAYTAAPTPATADNSTKIATTAFVKAQGYITSSSNITGTAKNVTGTVAIANGGTGATTRLGAAKALTNENVGTSATHFVTLTDSWGKFGYSTVANVKSVLGLGSAAYTASTAYAAASHTHSYLPLNGGNLTGYVNCTATYTNASTTYTSSLIRFNSCNEGYGNNVMFSGCANTIVGGGESANSQLNDLAGVSSENLYLTADANIYLKPGGNSWSSVKTITIDSSANMSGIATLTATKVVGAYYADYAEWFPKGEETDPGDVIVLDLDSDEEKYIRSTKDNKIVVGVHSDNYSHIIGGDPVPKEKQDEFDDNTYNKTKYIPVALAGRIKTKFIGKAKKGSYVVASEVVGVARAYDRTIDNPEDIFGILVETDNLDQEVRRLQVKLK